MRFPEYGFPQKVSGNTGTLLKALGSDENFRPQALLPFGAHIRSAGPVAAVSAVPAAVGLLSRLARDVHA
ncbi:hypothetical protein EMIT048CA2_320011 [Pseudomonas chlororaphis]